MPDGLEHAKLAGLLLASLSFAVYADTSGRSEVEVLRELERTRLRALVEADVLIARSLHADEFQLVTPSGNLLSKEQYLGGIADGSLDYLAWEPGEITVRHYGDVAALRYIDSEFLVASEGVPVWTGELRHTNVYEKRDGGWVIVWSQASGGDPASDAE
ncbi:MAG: nuclear transport factor 2 family protein [Pseudomonadota bacterium]